MRTRGIKAVTIGAMAMALGFSSAALAGVIFQPTSGITFSEAGGITFSEAGGITFSEAGGITFSEAGGITFSEAGGSLFGNPSGITFSEAGGITFSEAGGITFSEAGSVLNHLPDGITFSEAGGGPSIDLSLLSQLSIVDTGSLNVIVTYRAHPSASDLDDLVTIGIPGGTILRELPIVIVNATRPQVRKIATFPNVRSIWLDRNTDFFMDRAAREVHADIDLVETRGPEGMLTGRGIGVAILDTGIDTTHPDLAGRVSRNVRVGSAQGTSVSFAEPLIVENLPDSDLVYGHGTFVAGIIGASGHASGDRIRGLATGAELVGVGVGELLLTHVLEGMDAILSFADDEGIRVVNCSFGVRGLFDPDDPINIATREMHDRGIVVVMAAGNHGPAPGSISPYAVAPWVIGVAGTDGARDLATFSSRGYFQSALYAPTIAAPAVGMTSLRAKGTTLVGPATEPETLPAGLDPAYYTVSSGTSFATPVVSSLVARLFEANSLLTPDAVKVILQETATVMPRHGRSDVGAGLVNFAAAAHKANDPTVDYGQGRNDRHYQSDYSYHPNGTARIDGSISPATSRARETIDVGEGTASLHVTLGWDPSNEDLDLYLFDPSGTLRASSAAVNGLVLFDRTERVEIREPITGAWTAEIRPRLGFTSTGYVIAFESYGTTYRILDSVSSSDRKALELFARARVLGSNSKIRGTEKISRLQLARAFVAYGQPMFAPAVPTFSDVSGRYDQLVVESAAGRHALREPLFGPVVDGGASDRFDPSSIVTRLQFCHAIVRFVGLESKAIARRGAVVGVADSMLLTDEDRGYVSVALEYGLVDTAGGMFDPNGNLTSLTLARGLFSDQ